MTRRYAIAAATLLCLALGVWTALRVVGWSNLSQSGNAMPIVFDDYALQFYYGRLGGQFLSETGSTYGYDPSFMAGYVKSPIYYPSSKPFELSLGVFSGFDPAAVFNVTVFVMLAMLPLLIYAAAVNFRLSPVERLAVVAMSLLPHFLVPSAGFYGIMEAAGMTPFIFSSFLSVLVVSLIDRFLSSGGLWRGLAMTISAALLCFTHPTAALLAVVPIAALYSMSFRRLTIRRHAWLWTAAVGVVIANWPWVEGYLLFSHYADLSDFSSPEGKQHFVPAGGLLAPLRVYVPGPKLLSLIPPVFGFIGLWGWWHEHRSRLLVVFLPQIVVLFFITFYGGFVGLHALNPARFTLPLALYLFFPAAHGLIISAEFVRQQIVRYAAPRLARAIGSAIVIGLVLLLLVSDLTTKFWRPYTLPRLQTTQGFTRHGMLFMEWLRENTDPTGRLLHEETDQRSHQYYGSHLASLIPLYTGRELAGGPAPHALLKHNFLRFIAGEFQGRPISEIDPDSLSRYLSLYNVRWVLCWSKASKAYLSRLGMVRHISDYDKFRLYRVAGSPSFFLKGTGRIVAKANRIELRDVTAEDGHVIIKYHWLESLRSDPPRDIEPVHFADDPIPFISIADPPEHLVIYNDYNFSLND